MLFSMAPSDALAAADEDLSGRKPAYAARTGGPPARGIGDVPIPIGEPDDDEGYDEDEDEDDEEEDDDDEEEPLRLLRP